MSGKIFLNTRYPISEEKVCENHAFSQKTPKYWSKENEHYI